MDDQQDQTQAAITPDTPAKPLPWPDVTQKPEFQAMSPEDQEGARQQYFRDVVTPQVPKEDLDVARQQFDAQYGPDHPTSLNDVKQAISKESREESPGGPISLAIEGAGYLKRVFSGEEKPPGYPAEQKDTDTAGEKTVPVPPVVPAMVMGMTSSPAGNPLAGASSKGLLKNADIQSFMQDETSGHGPGGTFPIPQTQMTADEGLSSAKTLYNTADQKGGTGGSLTVMNKWLDAVQAQIPRESNAVTNARGGTPSPTQTLIDNLETNRGHPISYNGLDEMDKFLGNEAHQAFNKKDNLTGANISKINDLLLQTMKEAPPGTLPGAEYGEAARLTFMQQLKLRKIEQMQQFANNTNNPATSVRTQLRQLVKTETGKNGSPWSPDELSAADKAAKQGIVTDLLQAVGNRLSIYASGPGITNKLAAFGISKTARAAADTIQFGKAQNLAKTISDKIPSPYDVKGIVPRVQAGEQIPDTELNKAVK
jgi:hypothetical protein